MLRISASSRVMFLALELAIASALLSCSEWGFP